jgi:diguanylate cyclase (GGDEF)-like protein/PAS domain S-box-containing protein
MDTQFFQQMFEKHPTVMLLVEPGSGRIMSSNQAASDFYGYSRAQLSQMNARQINPLSPSETNQIRQAMIQGQQTRFIVPNRLASGEIRTVEVEVSPITWENKTVLFAIIRDITEHKRLEELLHQKEAQGLMQNIFATIPAPVFYKDSQGKYLACNQALADRLGKSMAEVIGLTVFDLFPEAVAQRYHEKDLAVLTEPPYYQTYEDKRYNHALQEERDWLITKSVIRDEQGQIMGLVGVMIDITERKQAEEALRESEQKLKTLLELLPVGITTLDMNNKVSYMNPMLAEILQISPENLARGDYGSRNYFYPDGMLMPNTEHATNRALNKQEAVYNFETGVRVNDNEMFWVNVTAIPVNFSDWRVIAVMNDITERKRLQAELEAAKQKMEQLVIYDLLTGVYNRVLLGEKLTEALTQRNDTLVAILIMDLDNFKQINDTYGHHQGDHLLIEVVARMKKLLRQADTLVRLGGDEFLMIAPGIKSQAQVEAIAIRLLKAVQQPIELAGVTVFPTLSIGLALCPHHGTTPQALMVNSDHALYEAKRMGRNCYAFARC